MKKKDNKETKQFFFSVLQMVKLFHTKEKIEKQKQKNQKSIISKIHKMTMYLQVEESKKKKK